ncbi:hypothetical protein [Streptomyces sp. NPDC086782]|uniref:hypothetical protein n=1 Tax=Streptomyces sp. NPDC086782 TaxID=3365757 RepID=UPI0038181637
MSSQNVPTGDAALKPLAEVVSFVEDAGCDVGEVAVVLVGGGVAEPGALPVE